MLLKILNKITPTVLQYLSNIENWSPGEIINNDNNYEYLKNIKKIKIFGIGIK